MTDNACNHPATAGDVDYKFRSPPSLGVHCIVIRFAMSRNIGTLKERSEKCREAREFVESYQEFVVFRCGCDEFVCKCDAGGMTIHSQSPIRAAECFARQAKDWSIVVVQDNHGNRCEVAFDGRTGYTT